MLIEKILIPKIEEKDSILEEDMKILKDEYIISKSKKNSNVLYLFPKDFFLEEPYFYNIFDLSELIKEKYGKEIIYLVLEENSEGNINYLIGNTKFINNKKYHVKGVILRDKWKKEMLILIKMIAFTINIISPKKIIIFRLSENGMINEIIKEIEKEFDKEYFIEVFNKKEFIKNLSKIRAYEKKEQVIIPYIVGLTISTLIFSSSLFLIKYKNSLTEKEALSKIDSYKQKIIRYRKQYYLIEKNLEKKKEILKKLESKKIYK